MYFKTNTFYIYYTLINDGALQDIWRYTTLLTTWDDCHWFAYIFWAIQNFFAVRFEAIVENAFKFRVRPDDDAKKKLEKYKEKMRQDEDTVSYI